MQKRRGRVIWITGLSGAGKTTLAKALLPSLPAPTILLDGDAMRDAFSPLTCGYDYESRKKLAHAYARWCKLLVEQGLTVVCATISMFHDVREWNRRNLPGYFEIFLDVPEDVRKQRDYKHVYATDHSAERSDIVGVTIPPELPVNSDLVLRQYDLSAEELATAVTDSLKTTPLLR